MDRHRLNWGVRYWSAHAQPVICHPELPFFNDIVTMALSVTGLPALVYVSRWCHEVRVTGVDVQVAGLPERNARSGDLHLSCKRFIVFVPTGACP